MINIRRRSLIGSKSTDLLYSLYNYQFSKESINTGVPLLKAGLASTILLDIKLDTTPVSGIGSTTKLIYLYNNSLAANGLYVGRKLYQNTINLWWMGSSDQASNIQFGKYRFKIVITHAEDSNDVTMTIKKYTAPPTSDTVTFSNTFTAAPINLLFFGGPSGADKLPTGTIYTAEVYNRVLTSTEINSFLAA